jgi:predicted GIY-YIG superfamily endonuclease
MFNAIIYKLYNDNGYYYYGSTKQLDKRFKNHLYCAKKGTNKLYTKMREEGIHTFKIEEVDKMYNTTYTDIIKKEADYIFKCRSDEKNLNTQIPILTDEMKEKKRRVRIEKKLLKKEKFNCYDIENEEERKEKEKELLNNRILQEIEKEDRIKMLKANNQYKSVKQIDREGRIIEENGRTVAQNIKDAYRVVYNQAVSSMFPWPPKRY